MLQACVQVLREWGTGDARDPGWSGAGRPAAIVSIPSRGKPALVDSLARGISGDRPHPVPGPAAARTRRTHRRARRQQRLPARRGLGPPRRGTGAGSCPGRDPGPERDAGGRPRRTAAGPSPSPAGPSGSRAPGPCCRWCWARPADLGTRHGGGASGCPGCSGASRTAMARNARPVRRRRIPATAGGSRRAACLPRRPEQQCPDGDPGAGRELHERRGDGVGGRQLGRDDVGVLDGRVGRESDRAERPAGHEHRDNQRFRRCRRRAARTARKWLRRPETRTPVRA